MDLMRLEEAVQAGESETVELKKSTAQLPRAGETLCAFLNGHGGMVVIGVGADGQLTGQQVADTTQQELARMLDRFEPPAPVEIRIVSIPGSDKSVIVLRVPRIVDERPFTYDGRPYQRVGTTTPRMPRERYQELVLQRAHASNRWENQPAHRMHLEALDDEKILRTVRLGIKGGRVPEAAGGDIGEILDRVKLREEGELFNAAVVLFGKDPLPDYPQCKLRLARFKGIDKSEFLDNRQVHGHAFQLLEEGMAFLLRHLPITGRFEPGQMERIDEPLLPVTALREALVNAPCHRDYSIPGGRSPRRRESWGLFKSSSVRPSGSVPLLQISSRSSKMAALTEPAGN